VENHQGQIIMITYALPEQGTYNDWSLNETEAFKPDPRQQLVVDAVQAALDSGLYYTDEVRAFCAKHLGVSAKDQESTGKIRTEGGEFGMDCYYARQYLTAQTRFTKMRQEYGRLNPHEGQKLGTLTFNDYKRTTGVVVMKILDEGRVIRLAGKRGASNVEFETDATSISCAFARAKEKGHRKDGFEEFVSKRGTAAPAAAPLADATV
jgi:hypothetical protein